MNLVLKDIRRNPLLWLLVFVPVLFLAAKLRPGSHTMLFMLSVLAIVPLAALLSHATESVAAKTGDAVGGLLNATLGNLTELVIALTALRAGDYALVKASIAGAIVANTLFMLGRIVPAGRPQAPHPGIQPRGCAPAGQLAVPGNDRAAHPVSRRHGDPKTAAAFVQDTQPRARPTSHCRIRPRHAVFARNTSGVFPKHRSRRDRATRKSLGRWDWRSACWRS